MALGKRMQTVYLGYQVRPGIFIGFAPATGALLDSTHIDSYNMETKQKQNNGDNRGHYVLTG